MKEREKGDPKGRCSVLGPSVNLVAAVADRLFASGKDYSENLVVFPGKRPAHFLRKALAEREQSPYIPPVILSTEEFIDLAYERLHGDSATRKMETIDAVAFLFEIHRGMENRLGGPQFLSLEAFFPLGLRIYRDLEELLIEYVEPARLREVEPFMETPLPPQTGAGLQSLSFFYDRFYTTVGQAGFSSRSQRYRTVSSDLGKEVLPFRTIIFAGFYALTECEKRIFHRLLGWENAFFIFQHGPGIESTLASIGIKVENAVFPPVDPEPHGPDIHFYRSADSHGQVFALSGLVRAHMERRENGRPHEGTVIVLPSAETLFPVLYHTLPLVPGGDYNISLGYPLDRTPAWGFLNGLMQLVMSMDGDRLYVPDYLSFVLHPYTKNIYIDGRTDITRILFHSMEELLGEDRGRSFVGLDEIEDRADLVEVVGERVAATGTALSHAEIKRHLTAIHHELIRKALNFESVDDFAGKMTAVLTFIYEHSSARLHPFFHPFVESFVEQLELLRRSRIRDLAFAERNSYFHFLKRYIAHCFSPFEGTPLRGVQVLGFLETRNLRFDRTYILDANEDVIPDTKKEESLLPFKVRQILGLPTYRDRDMLAAYYFDTLVRGSREVHVFFVENSKKEKSRFVEKLLWEKQKREKTANTNAYVKSLGYRLSLKNAEPSPVGKTASVVNFLQQRAHDATSLDVYLNCPLQFYYRYVLDLRKKEAAGPDIERSDVGRFVHKVLFTYFERRKGVRLTEKEIDPEEMRSMVGTLFEEDYGQEPIGSAYLLKQQIERQMTAFLKDYQAPLFRRAAVRILNLEQKIETLYQAPISSATSIEGESLTALPAEGATQAPIIAAFRLKGILDRVETRDDKTWIIDYKTGGSQARLAIDFDRLDDEARTSWSESIGSLQLPFYLLLYSAVSDLEIEHLDAMFLLLGKTYMGPGIELPLFGKESEAKSNYERARAVIVRLIREICDPGIPFDPGLRARDSCVFCDYQYLCGMQWRGR
ncbi:MAG: ATP-dependent helicase/deoxyribonuclease subunit B [Syntrophorhabdaceae bacterium PtaU1.Bin034]|nr:MAG: ATP-dependent helicase/deoxyribonuclease subunit B [Syntrophorhabdaceae bacterium PtaU1.Bin034]